MKVFIEDLAECLRIAEAMARFGKPMDKADRAYLLEQGLDYVRVVGCLKWIWLQWLIEGSPQLVQQRVQAFVDDAMERQKISPLFYNRPRHDLLLLHCAIFAASRSQLAALAERVVDAAGFKAYTPHNDGELYECAWCGVLKYWILGDFEEAANQSEIIWKSYQPAHIKGASKPLTTAWLRRDWKKFLKEQQMDLEKLWAAAKKNGTITRLSKSEVVASLDMYPVERAWRWGHFGLAVLAHRSGVDVITDPLWFPSHALNACR